MAEQTTPETGVAQEPPDIQSRMQNFLTQFDQDQAGEVEQRAEPEQSEQAAEPQTTESQEEVTVDDLPEEPQPTGDAFEIVHNGTQHKLTRADTIKYAQQGFDYTQKTQALAEQHKQAAQRLERIAQLEQFQPLLDQDRATVVALQSRLAGYQKVDWVQLASNDPMEYPKVRAQYDTLAAAYQQAVGQYNQKFQAIGQERQRLHAEQLRQEEARLPDVIPEWKDETKRESGKKALADYLIKQGVPAEALASRMDNALAVSIAYKAMKYDQLVQSKAQKVKQLRTAPPVTKPGAAQPSSAQADAQRQLEGRLKRSGDIKDAAALLANRWK